MDEKDKEIELLRHQLNRLRCFLWMNMPTYSCFKRKISNIDIWDYFNKKDPKRTNKCLKTTKAVDK